MKVRSAEFLLSAAKAPDFPRSGLPEIAFIGRSNVGKSSLINTLLNRRRLALTSRTPGKTRMINFFSVNGDLIFVDLPGYGYARVSRKIHRSWEAMVEGYLADRAELRGTVLLVDIRHPPTPLDIQMKHWLEHHRTGIVVAATKADKLSSSRRGSQLREIRRELALRDDEVLIPFSSRSGRGKDLLWKALDHFLR